MPNEDKIRIMTRLSIYEKTEGRKYLPISKYYRSDYIGLALIRNFFLVTIGYFLILVACAVYFSEYLMDNINKMDLIQLGTDIVAAYVFVLAFFSVLAYLITAVRYHKAKKSVRTYYQELTKLEKLYVRQERRAENNRREYR